MALSRDNALPEDQHFVLSSLAPSPAQKRLALGMVLGLLLMLALVMGPFGRVQPGVLPSFVAIYTTTIFVTDLLTAVLLFAQFSITRSRAILVIASGYLLTALLMAPYLLAFPGVFGPDGVVGGLQTSAALYLLWHCALPAFAIGYAWLKDEDPAKRLAPSRVRPAIVVAIAGTAALAAAAAAVCILAPGILPHMQLDRYRFSPEWPWLAGLPIALLCGLALASLWPRRRSILDLFLIVVLCAYLIEVPPHIYPVAARYSMGWYAVRIAGFAAHSVVLIVLLYEIAGLYGSLLGAVMGRRREREARLMIGDAVAASIAHELRQPLTAMVTSADAGLRFIDREAPRLDKAKEAFRRITADGHRAGAMVGNIRASFKGKPRERSTLDIGALIDEALALARPDLQRHGITVAVSPRAVALVEGDRVHLQQVLLHLITNAAEAMAANDGPRILRVGCEPVEGGKVMVCVADTGTGIAPLDAERIFGPLLTTQPGGMGMGLAVCRAIVEAHEGRLWFTPNVPRGAVLCFTVGAASAR